MKKNFVYKTALLFGFVLLASLFQSCAVRALPDGFVTFNKQTAQNGFMVGSITFPEEKARYNNYFFHVVSLDSDAKKAKKNSFEMQVTPLQLFKMKHNGQYTNGRTYLFAVPKAEGKYTISSVRLTSNYGGVIVNDFATGFSIPFEVKKGEIMYVGNVMFNEFAQSRDTLMTITDNYERDIRGLKKLQPKIDWSGVINNKERKVEYQDQR